MSKSHRPSPFVIWASRSEALPAVISASCWVRGGKFFLHFLSSLLERWQLISLPPDNPTGHFISSSCCSDLVSVTGLYLSPLRRNNSARISAQRLLQPCRILCAAQPCPSHGRLANYTSVLGSISFPAQPSSVWFVFCSHFGHCVGWKKLMARSLITSN